MFPTSNNFLKVAFWLLAILLIALTGFNLMNRFLFIRNQENTRIAEQKCEICGEAVSWKIVNVASQYKSTLAFRCNAHKDWPSPAFWRFFLLFVMMGLPFLLSLALLDSSYGKWEKKLPRSTSIIALMLLLWGIVGLLSEGWRLGPLYGYYTGIPFKTTWDNALFSVLFLIMGFMLFRRQPSVRFFGLLLVLAYLVLTVWELFNGVYIVNTNFILLQSGWFLVYMLISCILFSRAIYGQKNASFQ